MALQFKMKTIQREASSRKGCAAIPSIRNKPALHTPESRNVNKMSDAQYAFLKRLCMRMLGVERDGTYMPYMGEKRTADALERQGLVRYVETGKQGYIYNGYVVTEEGTHRYEAEKSRRAGGATEHAHTSPVTSSTPRPSASQGANQKAPASPVAAREPERKRKPSYTWVDFDPKNRETQPLPPEYKLVLVQLAARPGSAMPPAIAAGYLRNDAGQKGRPSFVCPGVEGDAVAWCDCLPEDFGAPLWPGIPPRPEAPYV